MGYSTLILITTLAFCVYACGSTKKETKPKNTADTIHVQPADTDSMPETPPPPEPSPSPETLQLQGIITDIHYQAESSSFIYEFKVLKIIRVGSSAPAVVLNDTLLITSSNRLKDIKKNMDLQFVITPRKIFGDNKSETAAWKLLRWNDNQDQE